MAMMMPNGIAAHKIVIGFFFFSSINRSIEKFHYYLLFLRDKHVPKFIEFNFKYPQLSISLFAHCNFSIRLNFKKFLNCKHNGPHFSEITI